ncbi:hypothetical protein PPERSA_10114 [Pseudocohnilembus persalinus]|uniref:Uncharacterized protein n=1 Tax=Pseudocohnilembus persalinus TaxID=266149 RepID=A0A0V0R9P7_PSEPJ|nr:hypothetical protein PPERSA_10114 [Pseudocohnilembus persalinus]|eukprot:KRX11182.1 hypothetical protein PPERSA_10114 [Pseudocohnilembus persalinus]
MLKIFLFFQSACSPTQQKIVELSNKWNNVSNSIDKERFNKRLQVEQKLKILSDNLLQVKPEEEEKFQGKKTSESNILININEKFDNISQTLSRNNRQYVEDINTLQNQVNTQQNDVESLIAVETQNRLNGAEKLQQIIQADLEEFSIQFQEERRARDETQNKIMRMVEDVNITLQQELRCEKKERQKAHEAMIQLLEETCEKLDTQFQL